MIKLNLKKILDDKGMTPYKLSKLTGIRMATIYGYINENRRAINLDNIAKIMKVLEVDDVGEIFKKE